MCVCRQILNQTATRAELYGRWVFVGTDGWGKKWYPVENFGRAAINAITIAPKLYLISGRCFESHTERDSVLSVDRIRSVLQQFGAFEKHAQSVVQRILGGNLQVQIHRNAHDDVQS